MKFSELRNKLNESYGDQIITHSANYKSRDHEAVRGHIKSLTSEYKELKAKHEPYGETGHKITWTGPRYLVHRAHNIMSQFNTSSKSQHDWFAKKGRERGEMKEDLIPSGKKKASIRRYAKFRSVTKKAGIPADAAANFLFPAVVGSAIGHPGIGAGVGAISAGASVLHNLRGRKRPGKKLIRGSHQYDKIAKRLDRERKRNQ